VKAAKMATREMLVQRLLQAFDYPNRETRAAADLVSLRRPCSGNRDLRRSQGGVGQVRYNRFFQEIKRFWKMAIGLLPERARAERGQRTE
jgi:hypothetical protein